LFSKKFGYRAKVYLIEAHYLLILHKSRFWYLMLWTSPIL